MDTVEFTVTVDVTMTTVVKVTTGTVASVTVVVRVVCSTSVVVEVTCAVVYVVVVLGTESEKLAAKVKSYQCHLASKSLRLLELSLSSH